MTSATRGDNEAIYSGADVSPWQQLGWRGRGHGLPCTRSRLNNREPSSPWRSVTRSVVHSGISYGARVSAESAFCGSRVDFSSSAELENNGSFEMESVLNGCLSGEKKQLLIPKLIPNEAQQNPPINQKLSFLSAARINVSGWAHLISRVWPHQRNLVVASPEQSPNGVQLPLQEQKKEKSHDQIWTI